MLAAQSGALAAEDRAAVVDNETQGERQERRRSDWNLVRARSAIGYWCRARSTIPLAPPARHREEAGKPRPPAVHGRGPEPP